MTVFVVAVPQVLVMDIVSQHLVSFVDIAKLPRTWPFGTMWCIPPGSVAEAGCGLSAIAVQFAAASDIPILLVPIWFLPNQSYPDIHPRTTTVAAMPWYHKTSVSIPIECNQLVLDKSCNFISLWPKSCSSHSAPW